MYNDCILNGRSIIIKKKKKTGGLYKYMLGTHTFPAAAEHSKRQWRHRITIAATVAQKVNE